MAMTVSESFRMGFRIGLRAAGTALATSHGFLIDISLAAVALGMVFWLFPYPGTHVTDLQVILLLVGFLFLAAGIRVFRVGSIVLMRELRAAGTNTAPGQPRRMER